MEGARLSDRVSGQRRRLDREMSGLWPRDVSRDGRGVLARLLPRGRGGFWFDRYELMKVDESHESVGAALLDTEHDLALVVDHEKGSRARRT